jgi:hypothetical protein
MTRRRTILLILKGESEVVEILYLLMMMVLLQNLENKWEQNSLY